LDIEERHVCVAVSRQRIGENAPDADIVRCKSATADGVYGETEPEVRIAVEREAHGETKIARIAASWRIEGTIVDRDRQGSVPIEGRPVRPTIDGVFTKVPAAPVAELRKDGREKSVVFETANMPRSLPAPTGSSTFDGEEFSVGRI
jgi:hypothetical protein